MKKLRRKILLIVIILIMLLNVEGTSTYAYTDYSSGVWSTIPVKIILNNGSDALSGHKSTVYSVSGAAPVVTNATEPLTISTDGTTVVGVTTTDNAGNTSTRSYVIKIDQTPPSITINKYNSPTYQYLNIGSTATDSTSGVAAYRFSKDGGKTWTNFTTSTNYTLVDWDFTKLINNGSDGYNLEVQAKDNAGNLGTASVNLARSLRANTFRYGESELIANIGGRTFNKKYTGGALTGVVYVTGPWTGPIMVSPTANSVAYYTSVDSTILGNSGTITYNGYTYYVSSSDYWMNSDFISDVGLLNQNSDLYSNVNVAASAFIDRIVNEGGTGILQNTNKWSANMESQFTRSYSPYTNLNTVTVSSISGWEILYAPLCTVPGRIYTITFDYTHTTSTTTWGSYTGVICTIVDSIGPSSDNLSGSLANMQLPTTVSATPQQQTITFTADSRITYLELNCGSVLDGTSTTFKVGNFSMTE